MREVVNAIDHLDAAGLLDGWRAWHLDQGHRPATIDGYRRVGGMWIAYLDRQSPPVPWWAAGPDQLRGFLDAPPADRRSARRRRGVGLSPATRCQYDKAVHGLYRWACDEGLIGADPMRRVRRQRQPDPIPRALGLEEVAALLGHVAGDERAKVAVWLAYGLGMRRSEITLARIEDVRLRGRPAMLVHGKGGRDRLVPLPEVVREVLAGYLDGRPRQGPLLEAWRSTWGDRHVPTGHALRPQQVGELISGAMRAVGIDETGHALRHTFATELLAADQGRNLRAVSRLLGHRSVVTTERFYTNSYDGDASAAAALLPDPRTISFASGETIPPALDPEVAGWTVRLEQVDPGLLDQIRACVAELEGHAPAVEAAMKAAGVLTSRFCASFAKVHPDVFSMQADTDREQVEDAIGVMAMWNLADRIYQAHPDN